MDDQIAVNRRRSIYLLVAFASAIAVVVAAVLVLAGLGVVGLVVAVLLGGAGAFVAFRTAETVALSLGRATPADPAGYARLHNLVEGLCAASGLPKPSVYVTADDAPNAFAAGRGPHQASIAVSTGLLAAMNRVELEGILAHELSHIRNGDVLVATLAITTAGLPTVLADVCLRQRWPNGGRAGHDDPTSRGRFPILAGVGRGLLGLSPLLAPLLHRAVGEGREARADLSAVEITRYPPGLIAALEKLRSTSTVMASGARATAHLWIASPLARTEAEGAMADANRRFDVRRPLDERIAALREL